MDTSGEAGVPADQRVVPAGDARVDDRDTDARPAGASVAAELPVRQAMLDGNPSPQTPDQLKPLIKPFPADLMDAYPVSTLVNTPANDRPELVVPAS